MKVIEAELQGGEFLRVGSTMFQVDVEHAGHGDARSPPVVAFGRVVGASREMRRLYPLCERLAQTTVPVIIEGETGTGKEVLAESLHEMGPRAQGPFVVFDCTAVPPSLVEAELFGHERGAFTGAIAARKGVFEQAHGGTLLIDEIGDLDLALQPKLLRAIERFEVRRIGGDKWIRVDVRVLAATRATSIARCRPAASATTSSTGSRSRASSSRRCAAASATSRVLATHFWREMGGDPRAIPRELMHEVGGLRLAGQRSRAAQRDRAPARARRPRRHRAAGAPPHLSRSLAAASLRRAAAEDAIDRFVDMGLPYPQARDRILDEFEQRFVRTCPRAARR